MIDLFLKAKHWQLFVLTFGLPFLLQVVMMAFMVISMAVRANPDPTQFIPFMIFFPAMTILFTAVIFGWKWSVVIGLQKKLPEGVSMNLKLFKVVFFLPLVYLFMFSMFIILAMRWMMMGGWAGAEPNPSVIVAIVTVIMPLHLFSIFCLFYILYFVAKTIKAVELQREVTFSDFAGEFFLIWFYPIGIWFVQPKINKMAQA
jgi:hypothetical protein